MQARQELGGLLFVAPCVHVAVDINIHELSITYVGVALTRTTCFSILVMLVILVNCVFMATKEEIPKTE